MGSSSPSLGKKIKIYLKPPTRLFGGVHVMSMGITQDTNQSFPPRSMVRTFLVNSWVITATLWWQQCQRGCQEGFVQKDVFWICIHRKSATISKTVLDDEYDDDDDDDDDEPLLENWWLINLKKMVVGLPGCIYIHVYYMHHLVIFQQSLLQVTCLWFHVPTVDAWEIQGAPLHRYRPS